MSRYGNCVSCDFPILLQKNNPVSCPACQTINAPISSPFIIGAIAMPLLMAGGAFLWGLTKKGAKYAALKGGEMALEKSTEVAKGKLEDWRKK